MIKAFFFATLFISIISSQLLAQTEPKITISLLANDKIADVNIDQDKYIKFIGSLTDLMKKEFQGIDGEQKIALLLISHKIGKPTVELYSKPQLKSEKEKQVLVEINALKYENTKLVDFPILIHVNVENGIASEDFKDIILPSEKITQEYEKADLKTKYELIKKWAIEEALPVLSAYEVLVEDQFAGVKNTGKMVSSTDFNQVQDITTLTSKNPDYWRASLEMSIGNQLIPSTKIFMLVSQGQLDIALSYLQMIKFFSNPKTTADTYLTELDWRLDLFNQQLHSEIEKGIAEHDKGNYEKAITVYNALLKDYPFSAWAQYELYFSQNALDLKNKKTTVGDRSQWDQSKKIIYACNPLYSMDVRANTPQEGYLLFRRQEMSSLFKTKEEKLNDVYKYADIAMDLGVYDFAAQLFFYSYTYSGGKNEPALKKFLYCIEKLGVTTIKENFKGDFKKEFAQIEKDKDKEMKSSATYKAFKE